MSCATTREIAAGAQLRVASASTAPGSPRGARRTTYAERVMTRFDPQRRLAVLAHHAAAIACCLLASCAGDAADTGPAQAATPHMRPAADAICDGPASTVLAAVPPSGSGGAGAINVEVHY